MVLLSDIQDKKGSLRKTVVTVVQEDGTVLEERRNVDGSFSRVDNPHIDRHCHRMGFVLDLKPDLQIAKCCEGVFLGSQDAAREIEELKKLKITHIVNAASGIPNFFSNDFIYKYIDAIDLPSMRLIDYFEEVVNFMRSAIEAGGKVFVHCNAGISRSTTLILAYMMKVHGENLHDAYNTIREIRPVAKPNNGFMQQLLMYEEQLEQKRKNLMVSSK